MQREGSGSGARRFLLEAIDPEMEYPVLAMLIEVNDVEALSLMLGSDARDDPELHMTYFLEPDELAAILENQGVAFAPDTRNVILRPWHLTDRLVHTGYELVLMLEGRKPFAVFSEVYPEKGHEMRHQRSFERYVAEGLLNKREVLKPFADPLRLMDGRTYEGVRFTYYVAPGQEWRIDAYLLLVQLGAVHGWNDSYERIEGALLGYEAWQTELWLARRSGEETHRKD